MTFIKIAAIIPARMDSQRLPGKPLLKIEGLPMIEHVRRRTLLCKGFTQVVVATCDEAITETVQGYGGVVIQTSPAHRVATERIVEAMQNLECTHVVNIQGDEILVLPADLEKMTTAIRAYPERPVWNAVAPLKKKEELRDASIVKCLLSRSGQILYCSRHFSPPLEPIHWVIGLLAYRSDILKDFARWPRSVLEEKESIEQMRFLENDVPVASVRLENAYPGINEPRDVEAVQTYLKEYPHQRKILQEILTS